MGEVKAIYGGPTGQPEVNENVVNMLEDWLEKAKSGQVIGVAVVGMHYDRLTSWQIGGIVGGYSMLGGAVVMQRELERIVEGEQ